MSAGEIISQRLDLVAAFGDVDQRSRGILEFACIKNLDTSMMLPVKGGHRACGSCFDRVHCDRSGHGVQSFRANRASETMPFFGYVFGSQEMLSLPAGQVTT